MFLGAHMSIKGGVHKAIERANSIGCTALQLFTTNARGWAPKTINDQAAGMFREKAADFGPDKILSHDSYLINLASPKKDILLKSIKAFGQEVKRCDLLGIRYLVMHPGSALHSPKEKALDTISRSFDEIFQSNPKSGVTVLIEITAGQGTALGSNFEEIAAIFDRVKEPERFGVCLDTCHAFAAGYDISNKKGWQKTFRDFAKVIDLERLKAFHVNDSKKELGSRVDRHEHIGKGTIGLEAFRLLMNDRKFKNLPMTLETPKGEDLAEDVENLKLLKSLIGKKVI